ncbi:helix-turn-helix transcriptional regulator [Halorussus salinus]|uniref:helix-turn-helix transcriptional regulator n=1 Tax=Halorussus salinus TaxID=1364935 RepID=UPI001093158E|nr:transcriptional regulator [Halorussus salinus]
METVCSSHKQKSLGDVLDRRGDLLNRLVEEPTNKRELVERLDCSRSTVDRSVRELESYDLVAYDEGQYRATTFGRLAAAEYRRFERRLTTIHRLKPALEWLPVEEFDLDLGCLADATVVVSTPEDPYAPANYHADAVAESDRFRGLLPAVGLNQMETATEAVGDGQRQTLVVEREVAEKLREKPHYAEKVEELLASGDVGLFVYDGPIPYFLGIYDEVVHVGVEDDDGIPRALVESDAPELREWAESTYADYRRTAREFDRVRSA